MSTSSADPAKLHAFVNGVKAARTSAETRQSSVAVAVGEHDRRL